ncbi:MAG: bifunctional oligoribonuclease/PAP phosphatase NrnA [Clostridia bacterium]|nr:bifunctional oligoribonuclease/PAP phosphatase NrnA [Clostridia bacterium]
MNETAKTEYDFSDKYGNVKKEILDCIEKYEKIIICRHKRPDGDAVGSSGGLWELIRAAWPEKKVMISSEERCDYVAPYEAVGTMPLPVDYQGALCIVVDTATQDRISDNYFQNCEKCIKIDHHIETEPYGDLSFVAEDRPSCSELIAELSFSSDGRLPMTLAAAEKIYMGMVTDSDRFRYDPKPETLVIAARLIQFGINTERIYSNLYIDTFEHIKFKASVTELIQRTDAGVAYMYITADIQKKYGLSREEASSVVSFMDRIKGCPIWLAFIDNMPLNDDGTVESIRVRLRSRFMPVDKLANKYGGGGHEHASGATVNNTEEMKSLIADADAIVVSYVQRDPTIF